MSNALQLLAEVSYKMPSLPAIWAVGLLASIGAYFASRHSKPVGGLIAALAGVLAISAMVNLCRADEITTAWKAEQGWFWVDGADVIWMLPLTASLVAFNVHNRRGTGGPPVS